MKVSNIVRPNGKSAAPNQIEVVDNGVRTFFSYGKKVAIVRGSDVTMDSLYWNYSKTTAMYRNIFLHTTTEKIRRGIDDGSIKLVNLNEE